MMKILKSLSLVVAVAAVAGGATYAMWSSKASITGNQVTSGSMSLKVDSDPSSSVYAWTQTFSNSVVSLANLYPRFNEAEQKGQIIDLKNQGTVDGAASISIKTTAQSEVSCADPEKELDANCADAGAGTLPENLMVDVYYGVGANPTFELKGHATLKDWNNLYQNWSLGTLSAQDDYSASGADASKLGHVKIVWYVPGTAGNDIMTDSANVNVEFNLTQ